MRQCTFSFWMLLPFVLASCIPGGSVLNLGTKHDFPGSLSPNMVSTPPPVHYFEAENENEWLQYAFTDELILKEKQIYPEIHTFRELSERINSYYIDSTELPVAYEYLTVAKTAIADDVLRVEYQINAPQPLYVLYLPQVHQNFKLSITVAAQKAQRQDSNLSAYAYFVPSKRETMADCAILLIPGSGINESTKIYTRDLTDYHGNILGITEQYCDTYIYVKPNEDFLAIHNGQTKLNLNFINAYLLNRGSAYSAAYIVDTLAVAKHLKERYSQLVLLGLS